MNGGNYKNLNIVLKVKLRHTRLNSKTLDKEIRPRSSQMTACNIN